MEYFWTKKLPLFTDHCFILHILHSLWLIEQNLIGANLKVLFFRSVAFVSLIRWLLQQTAAFTCFSMKLVFRLSLNFLLASRNEFQVIHESSSNFCSKFPEIHFPKNTLSIHPQPGANAPIFSFNFFCFYFSLKNYKKAFFSK